METASSPSSAPIENPVLLENQRLILAGAHLEGAGATMIAGDCSIILERLHQACGNPPRRNDVSPIRRQAGSIVGMSATG